MSARCTPRGARPAGEMDRRALRKLRLRPPWPRSPRSSAELALDADGRFLAVRLTSFGNMGAFLSNVGPMPSTAQRGQERASSVYRTPLIEVSTKCVFTNTTPVARLSRRRPARGQLLHGAADRCRRRRDGHRPPGAAPAQPHPAARDAVQDAVGHDLRQRRFPGRAQAGGRSSPTARASRARRRESRKRGKLRGRGIGTFSRGHRAAEQGDGRHPLRARRQRHAS